MRFAVLGGDRRMEILCGLLLRDGHKVSSFAMEKAELLPEVRKCSCLQSCVYGADCVLLPTPAEKAGLLFNPLSDEIIKMQELIPALWKGQLLCGGKLSPSTAACAIRNGLNAADIMNDPEFLLENGALTAEGAILKLIEGSEKSICGSRILVSGWGRIGKILSLRLKALGAQVSIAERKTENRAMAEILGLEALDFSELEGSIGDFDFIVNTVPQEVIAKAMLCLCKSDAVLLELASAPGGFDRLFGENIGLKIIHGPGLPGKYSALSAALIIKDAVYRAIKNLEE